MSVSGILYRIELASGEDKWVIFPQALFVPDMISQLSAPLRKLLSAEGKDWDLLTLAECLPKVSVKAVEAGGARVGDTVLLSDEGIILEVHGSQDFQAMASRPSFSLDVLRALKLKFPVRRIPLGASGDTAMLITDSIAPVGVGGFHLITGDANTGKSTTARNIGRAVLRSVGDGVAFNAQKTVVIYICAGERPQDSNKVAEMLAEFPDVPWEFYAGSKPMETAINALIALARIRRFAEMGYDVIVFLDSVWGLVLKLGALPGINPALAATGVARDALNMVRDNFMVAGSIAFGGSITVFATCIDNGDAKSAQSVVLTEIGKNTATSVLHHYLPDDPGSALRPFYDLVASRSRELDDIFDGDLDARAAFDFIQAKLQAIPLEKRMGILRDMFNEVRCFELAKVEEWFRVHETKVTTNGWQRAHQNVINAATQLSRLQPHQKLSALAALMEQGGMGKFAEAVVLLLKLSQPTLRDEVFALLVKEDLMPKPAEVPPSDLVLQVAEKLRGAPGLRELLVKVIIAAGLTVDQLLVEEGDEALVEEIHAAFAGKFKKSVARQLVAAGYRDVEELRLLLKSTTPRALISKPRRSS